MSKHAKTLPGTVNRATGSLYIERRIDLPKEERFKIDLGFYNGKATVVAIGRTYLLEFNTEKGAFVATGDGNDSVFYKCKPLDGGKKFVRGYAAAYLPEEQRARVEKALRGYVKKHPPVEIESYS